MSRFLSILTAFALIASQVTVLAAPSKSDSKDHKKRLDVALKQFESKDEEANVKLTIFESDGSVKSTREFVVQRAGNRIEQRALIRMMAPNDLKGTSLLSIVRKKTEDQWIYLPSSKQTRKIATSEQSEAGILGSELRYEDFNPAVIRRSKIRFVQTENRDNKTYDIFETAIPRGISPYQRARFWIENGQELPVQIDYFIKNDKVKTVQFQDFKKVGELIRPHKVVIKNLRTNKGTTIEMADYKINKGIAMSLLSVESLAKSW